ncbi:MAG TPA: hemin uptake protein HemP [Thiobacillus sp.]|nr:MAG: hemin uptake protein HemP [Hydrogenophilales bacterium 28-61-11]OYZ57792.1 MAG: hemin uptake protein HemP [Hydrogenophilales bacterium 16-61-112]OZA48622.1 MAG: hemin uptake protein HemP [Hydrogenophilales bacterium 17-61-76]HQT32024.1 hemin uptake protein HemP [Thiobacillus sp.]HQT69890.1 hemin uptake protein HemP [Thiobacillus sp.]
MNDNQTRVAPVPSTGASRHPVEPATRSLPPGAIPTAFLFQGTQEILIDHNGEHYRLRITKNGKLILTK